MLDAQTFQSLQNILVLLQAVETTIPPTNIDGSKDVAKAIGMLETLITLNSDFGPAKKKDSLMTKIIS